MSTHEITIALSFLHITLNSSSDLTTAVPGGFWPGSVPSNKTPPFGLYGYQSGFDTLTSNGVRLITQPLYQVRVSGPASIIDQVAAAAALTDDVLKRTVNTSVTGGLVAASYRESPVHIDEQIDGVPWVSIGGLYRLVLQQVPA